MKGDLHEIVAGMMGGGPSCSEADATPIITRIWAEVDPLIGSTAGDSYTRTQFGDTLAGKGGNDSLNGAAGADCLLGRTGNDRLDGGEGLDLQTGCSGADVFIFSSASMAHRDWITDFGAANGDVIDLRLIDAQEALAGNQSFSWLGTGAFTR